VRDGTDGSGHAKMHVEAAGRKVNDDMEPVLVGHDASSLAREGRAARGDTEIEDFPDLIVGTNAAAELDAVHTL